MRVGVVVPRYGDEVAGRGEGRARQVAERLARLHRVEVLTTCAIDELTWENEYRAGETAVGGLPVRRFPVARRRSPERFADLSSRVRLPSHTDPEEGRWIEEHGPVAPGLVRHLDAAAAAYDALVFFSYRHWTTYHGLRVAPGRSLLVPDGGHDPWVRLRVFRDWFRLPAGIAFDSPEERARLLDVTGAGGLPGDVVGVAVDDGDVARSEEIRRRLAVLGEFVVYAGRIERDCSRLFADFIRYVQEQGAHLNLVLVGKAVLPIPVHANVAHLGVLAEAEKRSVVAASRLLVDPGRRERPSVPLLEAWTTGRPVLVNGDCDVLRGQVQRSGGGLYYTSYEEFAEALTWLRSRPGLAEALGRAGHAYVERNHTWDVVLEKYERLLALAAAPPGKGA